MTNAEIIKAFNCPYYEDGNILFLNTDCMKLMNLLPDKFFNLAICDPPYGINFDTEKPSMSAGRRKDGTQRIYNKWTNPKEKSYKIKQWDNNIPDKYYFDKLLNISKDQIIWGGNYYTNYLESTGGWIIWDKMVTMTTLSKCELAWTKIFEHTEIFHYLWAGFRKAEPVKRIHVTEKPIALYLWLLDNYANPNDLIFDSHVGSASSLIACMQKGFKCIGTELDSDYFNDAVKRIKLERAKIDGKFYLPEDQNNLFGGLT